MSVLSFVIAYSRLLRLRSVKLKWRDPVPTLRVTAGRERKSTIVLVVKFERGPL